MSITELVAMIGCENILVQPLNECITGATYSKKLRATRVTFVTNQFQCADLVTDNPQTKIGLILWIPKQIVDRVNAEEGAKSE